MVSLRAWVVTGCLLTASASAAAQTLSIAAAADLQTVMPELAERFERAGTRTIRVTYGSSGNFFSQIQNGAPFDIFFSADVDYPRRLDAAGLIVPGSMFIYATGRIVLWARKDGPVDLSRGLAALLDPRVRHVAIANPEHAPYGRAAIAALDHERIGDRVKPKLILGENVSQAAQFVDSGNADAGIIALSLALSPALKQSGAYYEIPSTAYPSIEQAVVILKPSANKAAAAEFLAFLRTPDVARLMQAFGFVVTPASGRGR